MNSSSSKQKHTTTNCPQRSMAWITLDKEEKITSATKEMIHLLNLDPTNQYLSDIWQTIESDQSYQIVSTFTSLRTLSVCTHHQDEQSVLICTDITDLNHMYTKGISITRLTMYGTIEAAFKSQQLNSLLEVGQPMMRYIHHDDVQEFCAGLNEATKFNSITSFHIRFVLDNQEDEWSELTVMTIEGGKKVLCLIKPSSLSSTTTTATTTTKQYDGMVRETVTQIQSKFWYAIEHGMTFIARSIATTLLLVISTLWQVLGKEEKTTWTGLFAASSEYVLRRVVKCTKERPELNTVCKIIGYCGIKQDITRNWIDITLDRSSEWLISKTQYINGVDAVV
jgi:hypothetical protein